MKSVVFAGVCAVAVFIFWVQKTGVHELKVYFGASVCSFVIYFLVLGFLNTAGTLGEGLADMLADLFEDDNGY